MPGRKWAVKERAGQARINVAKCLAIVRAQKEDSCALYLTPSLSFEVPGPGYAKKQGLIPKYRGPNTSVLVQCYRDMTIRQPDRPGVPRGLIGKPEATVLIVHPDRPSTEGSHSCEEQGWA